MNINKIRAFFKEKSSQLEEQITQLNRQIHIIGSLRLALVILAAVGLYVFWSGGWMVWLAILFLCAVPFLFLMVRHNHLFFERAYNEEKRKLCEQELAGLSGDYSAFDGGGEERNADHSFTLDLDIFGDKSIFQLVNRTVTSQRKPFVS